VKTPSERGNEMPRGTLPHQALGVIHGQAMRSPARVAAQ